MDSLAVMAAPLSPFPLPTASPAGEDMGPGFAALLEQGQDQEGLAAPPPAPLPLEPSPSAAPPILPPMACLHTMPIMASQPTPISPAAHPPGPIATPPAAWASAPLTTRAEAHAGVNPPVPVAEDRDGGDMRPSCGTPFEAERTDVASSLLPAMLRSSATAPASPAGPVPPADPAPPGGEGEGPLVSSLPGPGEGPPLDPGPASSASSPERAIETAHLPRLSRDTPPAAPPAEPAFGVSALPTAGEAGPAEAPRAEATAPPPPPPPARQVAPLAVALAFAPALGRFSVALDPPQLGRVEVAVTRAGEAHQVRILAERPETLALLERDRGELDRALAEAGVVVGEGGLRFALAGDSGAGGQPSDGRDGEPPRFTRPGQAPLAAAPPPAPLPGRGLLDLRI